MRCYISTCKSTHLDKGVQFYKLPTSKPLLLEKWLKAIGSNKSSFTKWMRICSNHFSKDCFILNEQKRKLKWDAYPNLFLSKQSHSCIEITPKRKVNKIRRRLQFDENHELQIRNINIEHNYCKKMIEENNFEKQLKELKQKIVDKDRIIRNLRMKLKRRNDKMRCLINCIDHLKNKNQISENGENLLKQIAEDIPKSVIARLYKLKFMGGNSHQYPPELRKFALTLHFLSPKGYDYVRRTFKKCLPHPTTIYRWYVNINGEPGICEEALNSIIAKCEVEKKEPLVGLTFDEMSIRKHVDFDGEKNIGFVDFGIESTNTSVEHLPVAENVIVYMAVSLNSNWKVPVAYYFIKTLTGQEKANILKNLIINLEKRKIKIAAVTCDGMSSNLTMARILGVSFQLQNFNTKLKLLSHDPINFILDPCHMLKLVRNYLFKNEVIFDMEGNEINVKYIKLLQELQQREGLRLANKLSANHINWQQQPMKVKLAAQTLSSSVADAIDFCRDILLMDNFKNSAATSKFIRIIDRLFDFGNSRNIFATNYKAPLKILNERFWLPFVKENFIYISQLKEANGNVIIETSRKTGFLGFMVLIKSAMDLFEHLLKKNNSLKYILTYKLSQDHLELYFSSIRSRGVSTITLVQNNLLQLLNDCYCNMNYRIKIPMF